MQAESFFTSENCLASTSADTQTSGVLEHRSLEEFLDHSRSAGYRVEHQAAWPNGAGWIALAHEVDGVTQVDLMVNYYPDHTFTSRAV